MHIPDHVHPHLYITSSIFSDWLFDFLCNILQNNALRPFLFHFVVGYIEGALWYQGVLQAFVFCFTVFVE